MRKSTINCLTLTILSFFVITKWWYVLVIDGTDEIMYGFPFIYTCSCFHTSLCSQYFILELTIDFSIYFLFWFILNFLFTKYIYSFSVNKWLRRILFIICGLILSFQFFMNSIGENTYSLYRNFDYTYFTSGFDFFGIPNEHPNYNEFIKENH